MYFSTVKYLKIGKKKKKKKAIAILPLTILRISELGF